MVSNKKKIIALIIVVVVAVVVGVVVHWGARLNANCKEHIKKELLANGIPSGSEYNRENLKVLEVDDFWGWLPLYGSVQPTMSVDGHTPDITTIAFVDIRFCAPHEYTIMNVEFAF